MASFLTVVFLLFLQGLPPLVGPLIPETGGRVTGIVRRADTGQPIPETQVALVTPGESVEQALTRAVITDVNGRFTLKGVAPGPYTLVMQSEGYFAPGRDSLSSNQVLRDVAVIEGQQTEITALELVPGAAISGRLSGPDGTPITGGFVEALRASYVRGQLTFSVVKSAQTDDLGEYRLFWLLPGDYYIRGQYRAPARDRNERYPRIFFPGIPEEDAAPPITVGAAREMSGIDIQVTVIPVTGFTISGTFVVTTNEPSPLPVPFIEVVPRDRRVRLQDDEAAMFRNQAADSRNGRFEIRGVPPGEYTLIAAIRDENGNRSGRASVDVADRNVDDIPIVIDPALDLSGHVKLDDEVPGDRLSKTALLLSSIDDVSVSAQIKADSKTGEFAVPHLAPGKYMLEVGLSTQSADVFIAEATQGNSSVLDSGIVIESASREPLEIQLKSHAGSVFGTVLDVTRLRPYSYATVTLVPEMPRRGNFTLYREQTCAADGRFTFFGLPPGNYKVFAWQAVAAGASQNPIFLRRYEDRGVSVVVEAGTEKGVEVIAIP